jgi:hypothetical protein
VPCRWLEWRALGHNHTREAQLLDAVETTFLDLFGNRAQTATKVSIDYAAAFLYGHGVLVSTFPIWQVNVQSRLDPFSSQGQQWLRAMRSAVGNLRCDTVLVSQRNLVSQRCIMVRYRYFDDGTLPRHAVEIGEWHFSGMVHA